MIDRLTEQKIKDSAKISDVVQNLLGVRLHAKGGSHQLQGLCPFHQDKREGSFQVNESKNICSCFSCGNVGLDPIKAVMVGKKVSYVDALRDIAHLYGIRIDGEPLTDIPICTPREPAPELPIRYWGMDIVTARDGNREQNNLLQYLESLPLTGMDKDRLNKALADYHVGTSVAGYTSGRVIWWYIDDMDRVVRGKFMAYKKDGHRDKSIPPTWLHSIYKSVGAFDDGKERVGRCLFGLHLIDKYPDAEICIVESEKSAIICSAFVDSSRKIWMATGGMCGLSMELLQPLIERGRKIVLYPDNDGYEDWSRAAGVIGYRNMKVSDTVRKQIEIEIDGQKADIADIMIRLLYSRIKTQEEKVLDNLIQENKEVGTLVANLGLRLDKVIKLN